MHVQPKVGSAKHTRTIKARIMPELRMSLVFYCTLIVVLLAWRLQRACPAQFISRLPLSNTITVSSNPAHAHAGLLSGHRGQSLPATYRWSDEWNKLINFKFLQILFSHGPINALSAKLANSLGKQKISDVPIKYTGW